MPEAFDGKLKHQPIRPSYAMFTFMRGKVVVRAGYVKPISPMLTPSPAFVEMLLGEAYGKVEACGCPNGNKLEGCAEIVAIPTERTAKREESIVGSR